jgi:acyl carrier protein
MSRLNKEEVTSKVKEIISGVLEQGENVENINDDTNLLTDYGFDSIMLVELISEIEDSFDIMFSDEDMDIEKLYSFGGLIKCIIKNL